MGWVRKETGVDLTPSNTLGGLGEKLENVAEDVGDFVSDTAEAIGDLGQDVIDVVKDAGSWIDDNVLQPMLDDPVKTALTIAAIAAGQPQLIPYINAADAAAKGGDLEDIGKAYAISYVATEAGTYVGAEVAGQTGSQAAGNIAKGATKGATSATLKGGDPGTGAIFGGVIAGAGEAVTAIKDVFKGEGPNIEVEGGEVPSQELGTGITPTTSGEGFNPVASSQPGLDVNTFAADAPEADYSLVAPEPEAQTYSEQDQSYEIAPAKPVTETGERDYEIDSSKIELMPTPDQEYDWEGVGKYVLKQGQKALGQTILSKLLGIPTGDPRQRSKNLTGIDTPSSSTDISAESAADPTVRLQEVAVSKYDLKTFANDAGNTMNIPFKDDEPEIPIPPGYKEVKMNVGGLAKRRSKKQTSVVQSAPSKPKTRKGLAVKI
jgi:hypothetical protein